MGMNTIRRPAINLPRTSLENVLEIVAIIGLAALIGVSVWGWLILPETIPTHFKVTGQPDAYGGKITLFILPAIGSLLYILFTSLGRYPHKYNYPWPITEENAARQYLLARLLLAWIKVEILFMFALLQWFIVQAALKHSAGIMLWVTLGSVACIFGTVFVYFRLARQAR